MALFPAASVVLKNNLTVVLKSCSVEDARLLPAFQEQIARETTHTKQYEGKPSSVAAISKHWAAGEADSLTLILGAFVDGRLVGQIALYPQNAEHPWFRHLARFAMMVLKDFWGTGLAKRLLSEAESFAQSAQFTRIEAMVRTSNERGIQLYLRNGFLLEGCRRRAAFVNGRFEDEYFIAKLLSADKCSQLNSVSSLLMFVTSVEQSADWYGKALERAPIQVDERFALFRIGVQELGLHLADMKSPLSTGGTVPYWWVDNFNGCVDHFVSLGATVYRGPIDIPNRRRICQLLDPFGNVLGIEGPDTCAQSL